MIRFLGKIVFFIIPIAFLALSLLSYSISDTSNYDWYVTAFSAGHYFHGVNHFQIHDQAVQQLISYYLLGAPLVRLVLYNFINVVKFVLFVFPIVFFVIYDLAYGTLFFDFTQASSTEKAFAMYTVAAPIVGLMLFFMMCRSKKNFFNVENKNYLNQYKDLAFCIYGKEGQKKMRLFLHGRKYEFTPKDITSVKKVNPTEIRNRILDFGKSNQGEGGYYRRNVVAELVGILLFLLVGLIGELITFFYNKASYKSGNIITLNTKSKKEIFIPSVDDKAEYLWLRDKELDNEYDELKKFISA